jgi:hypothetical protein
MSCWALGDSKRLWYNLTKPISMKYVEGDQELHMQLTYLGPEAYKVNWSTAK